MTSADIPPLQPSLPCQPQHVIDRPEVRHVVGDLDVPAREIEPAVLDPPNEPLSQARSFLAGRNAPRCLPLRAFRSGRSRQPRGAVWTSIVRVQVRQRDSLPPGTSDLRGAVQPQSLASYPLTTAFITMRNWSCGEERAVGRQSGVLRIRVGERLLPR